MNFFQILKESRVDDFKTKYSKKFSQEQLGRIVDNVPQKFLDWVGKNFESINFDDGLNDLARKLREFEKISSNLPKTDINSYQNIKELADALLTYENKPRREYQEVEGGKVVYDDGKYFVVNPQTHKSNCYYGSGTKWCTVADSDYQFNQYNKDGKLFYILDRNLESTDPFYKVALLRKFDGNNTFWDAKDNTTMILRAQMGTKPYDEMMSEIDKYMNSEYAEQIKIFSDKKLAKKERERQEALRLARILNERRDDAADRRVENEWQLGPDCPEEGLKAHALLGWLVEQSDVEARTPEQTARLMMLEDLLPQLQEEEAELENEGGDIIEISDKILEVEREILELSDKIDVYNIIPTGYHYDMSEFEVIDAGLDDRRYAVGDEDEVKSSCVDRVDQLIDDIGYDGFSNGFARSYIDAEKVAEYAEGFYEDDVYNNPEVYLDENDRQLSESQEREISVLKYRITKTQKDIENLEEVLDVEENDWSIYDKIKELEELIQEYEGEIEDIENDPEGEFPDDLFQEKIDELVNDVRSDPDSYLNEFGLDWEGFIDKDEFIEGVIDADGYGHTLNGYDGNVDEIEVQGTWYYVMRID